ncbi:glutamyl-tRNA reductase [Paenibacillus mesotrionivorans]|uniref:Glutamyl-tRNA reductase n=1 Tax=Paenibacillus mesotrionivorans TaxID=3160968 RepID=A0ACC7NZL3_9BACL
MHIVTVGLNHRTAPVEIREKFTFAPDRLPDALEVLKGTKSVLECVIVGTCNRTEVYAAVDRKYKSGLFLRSFLEQWFQVPRSEFEPYLYVYEDNLAVEHLFRVASGLDSMIIGETQILGQVKDAFLMSQREGATGTLFNTLFKQAVTFAKRAHAETSIGENPVSVSYAAVELGKRILHGLEHKNALIIGAGKMSELTAKHLQGAGVNGLMVVNRTLQNAMQLASRFQGTAHPYGQLLELLPEADIVISSSGSQEFVLDQEQVRQTLQSREANRPLFMVDIAVPRNLDPAIGELPGVHLFDIDDLESLVESNLDGRRREADKLTAEIEREAAHFQQWMKTLKVTPVIQALQEKSNRIYEETMESMMKKLPGLDEREQKVIRKLAKSIVNQMMRDPILRVKDMAGGRYGEEALGMFTELFALEGILAEQEENEAPSGTIAGRMAGKSGQELGGLPALLARNGTEAMAGS